ncbi:hypothetical protein O6H91_06G083000 [Diphasiastrum complanatum]|uniref:Uncharacterized protein n=1 Tax=Diphasiastrum complanatum TaxID=34168 RepID=A0ACC2DFL2_DIPCM|nr:hypothetical protein O6H91_06G083000 [Diphasiastrum complanatum]
MGNSPLSFSIREIRVDDLNAAAELCFQAFWEHNVCVGICPSVDFQDVESARLMIQQRLLDPLADGIVAVNDRPRRVIAVGFIHYGRKVNSVTAVAVDPKASGKGVGKAIMLALLEKSRKTEAVSIRLTQSATNIKSFALYFSIGFMPVECLCNFCGNLQPDQSAAAALSVHLNLDGLKVRQMEEPDLKICSDLFNKALGYDRERELRATLSSSQVWVVTKSGSIQGFATGFNRTGYIIATSEEACVALYCNASGYVFANVLCQLYPKILKWALAAKLPLIRNAWIMVRGEYQRPANGLVWAPGLH